jgi:hypothetical protein
MKRQIQYIALLCLIGACSAISGDLTRFEPLASVVGSVDSGRVGEYVVGVGKWHNPLPSGLLHVAVGAPGLDSGRGKVLLYAWDTGPDSLAAHGALFGQNAGDRFGQGLATLPDVDADSVLSPAIEDVEMIVGAPGYNNGAGKVYVLLTGLDSLSNALWTKTGQAGENFGETVASSGGLQNDGQPYLFVGAPGANKVYVFRYNKTNNTFDSIYTHSGSANSQYGLAIAGVGHIDGDSYDDYLIGAPYYRRNTNADSCGAAFLYSGANHSLLWKDSGQLIGPSGLNANPRYGYAVSSAGDWNNDNVADFMVGAPWAAQTDSTGQFQVCCQGRTYVYSGYDYSLLYSVQRRYPGLGSKITSYAYSGFSIAGGFDFGNDGYDDILIGAPGCIDFSTGAVFVGLALSIAGGSVAGTPTVRDTLLDINGSHPSGIASDEFSLGYDINMVGDLDADGLKDIAVTSRDAESGGTRRGAVEFFYAFYLGDADNSSFVNISDVVYLTNYIYSVGPAPVPMRSGDTNEDGNISISDVSCLINYIFSGSNMPCR